MDALSATIVARSSIPRWMCLASLLLGFGSPLAAQHDPGRDALRLIARGKHQQAITRLETPPRRQNSPVDAAETSFVLAIAACEMGDHHAAKKHLQTAVQEGLPSERLLAGARECLTALRQDASFAKWLGSLSPTIHQRPLLHGPMLSQVTDQRAEVWLRTETANVVRLLVKPGGHADSGQTDVLVSAAAKTDPARDYTAVVGIDGLQPDMEYLYQLEIDQQQVTDWIPFRTFPLAGNPAAFRIAFGGGAGYTPQFHHMWQTILRHQPLAMLMLGDNVYIDDPEHVLTQRYCYYRRQSEPLWRGLVARTSLFSIYDDHDFGTDDCYGGPEIDDPPWKRTVWNVFRENWNNPAYGGGEKQPGCWYDFQIGDVHFIMLDGRYYRDPNGGSMLGPVQREWLLQTLGNSKGTFKLLISPVPWSPGIKPGSKDPWDGFPDEREQIFSFIEQQKIEGVVLMAADRHRSDLRRIVRNNAYPLFELMSSRLTNVHTHPLMKDAKGSEFIMGYNDHCSFGRVDFDTTRSDPTLTYSIINIDDAFIGEHTIRLSELRHP